jgi:hypothetical protein
MSDGTRAAVVRAGDRKANTVRELLHALETCSDDSIYRHMSQMSGREEFANGNASNGFAELAKKINEIDLTKHTLESARESALQLIDAEPVRLV